MSESTPITGYRQLSEEEIALMNKVKAHAEATQALFQEVQALNVSRFSNFSNQMCASQGESARWCSIARTQLQQGYMALNRAIALPTTF